VILTTLYLTDAKNTNSWHARTGDLHCASPLDVLMVPSSSIPITAHGECLVCGGFSLGEPVCLGNFEFIAEYFGVLCLSPRRGNEGVILVCSSHSKASTMQRARIEDSTKEFVPTSSGEGSFRHPSPRRRRMGASFAPTTTTT
jgi:hypothetical protein